MPSPWAANAVEGKREPQIGLEHQHLQSEGYAHGIKWQELDQESTHGCQCVDWKEAIDRNASALLEPDKYQRNIDKRRATTPAPDSHL